MKTYADRRPPFLWKRQPPREVYLVLNGAEAKEYENRLSDLRKYVRERADHIFARDATPQLVKICDEKGVELNIIHRTPPTGDEKKPAATIGSSQPGHSSRRRIPDVVITPLPDESKARNGEEKQGRKADRARRMERIKFLTVDEWRRLFAAMESRRDRALFLIAYRHGLRASEVGLLHRTDFDEKQHRLNVHRLKGSLPGVHKMQADEVRVLKEYLWERKRQAEKSGADDTNPLLFPDRYGNAISRFALDWLMRRSYGVKADLPAEKRHFHVLKHSIAVHLLDAGADLRFVQDWLGHADISNTVIYATLTSRTRDEKARTLFMKMPRL
jgi:integrase